MKLLKSLGLALVLAAKCLRIGIGCEISGLKSDSESATSIQLSWTASEDCLELIQTFDVELEHKSYKACVGGTSDHPPDKNITTSQRSINVTGLEPYSVYEVRVAPTGQTPTPISVSTKASSPRNTPLPSSNPPVNQVVSIQFFWEPPETNGSACQLVRGLKDGYRVELYGLDAWVLSNQPLVTAKSPINEYFFTALKPNTRYKLRIYTQNQKKEACSLVNKTVPCGLYNPGLAYEVEAKTKPTKPQPPTNVKATALSSTEVNLRWVPSYPPTGMIAHYTVKRGIPRNLPSLQDITWTQEDIVTPDRNACHGTTSKRAFQDPFCYRVSGLDANSTYAFQIRTVNVNVEEPSEYSVTVITTTDQLVVGKPTTTATIAPANRVTTAAPTLTPTAETNNVWSTVLVVATVLLLFILAAVCYSLRDKIRSATEEMVRTQKGQQHFSRDSPTVSEYPMSYWANRSSAGSTGEGYIERSAMSQIADIQRRRLPEPPPTSTPIKSVRSCDDYYDILPDQVHPRHSRLSEHPYVVPEKEEEDYSGGGEYLKPTFVSRQSSCLTEESRLSTTINSPIEPASYLRQGEAADLQHCSATEAERRLNTSAAPLIHENSIEI